MATAFKDPTIEVLDAIAAELDLMQNEHEPIPADYDGPAPECVIVRDVTMIAGNGILDFKYTIPRPRGPIPDGGIEEVIEELLAYEPAGRSALARATAGAKSAKAAEADSTGGVELISGEDNPLDLNVDRPSYVVFRLSTDWKWRFDPDQAGITTKLAAEAHGHGGLRHVVVDAQGNYDQMERPQANCRIAYFIANPPAGVYFQGFNLEVELEQTPGPLGNPRVMPISIDPDVRNPGGSGE